MGVGVGVGGLDFDWGLWQEIWRVPERAHGGGLSQGGGCVCCLKGSGRDMKRRGTRQGQGKGKARGREIQSSVLAASRVWAENGREMWSCRTIIGRSDGEIQSDEGQLRYEI